MKKGSSKATKVTRTARKAGRAEAARLAQRYRVMISEHPDVIRSGYVNEPLGLSVKHAMYCAAICNSCADACLAEPMDMHQCIRLCLDCADVCAATSRVVSRQTEYDANVTRPLLEACIAACRSCGDECGSHGEHMPHCTVCSEQCRQCETACRELLDAMS